MVKSEMSKSAIPKDVLEKIKKNKWFRHGVYRTNILTEIAIISGLGSEWFAKEDMEKGMSNIIFLNDEAYVIEEEFKSLVDMYCVPICVYPLNVNAMP